VSASSRQSERVFKRITAHLRAQVAELRRLERAGAPAGELAERRREIAQLQSHLAGAVRSAVAPARVALGAPPD
jgi:hypothetical protein